MVHEVNGGISRVSYCVLRAGIDGCQNTQTLLEVQLKHSLPAT